MLGAVARARALETLGELLGGAHGFLEAVEVVGGREHREAAVVVPEAGASQGGEGLLLAVLEGGSAHRFRDPSELVPEPLHAGRVDAAPCRT